MTLFGVHVATSQLLIMIGWAVFGIAFLVAIPDDRR
ncbi:hypothetical protein MTAT_20250 [Moorella thermoacetica]|uniref:Uncharacterized protein n=1 Tax=Neomoorella thermoacetica TaxID=1525 RepID=A0AAC9HJ90_NEOTH|nr:hypothetical protein Maut_02252 [Moorella thermoacetica]TYL12783.1 hypothetical protein MTAT_20250 [Moorella thermoacetica]